ncbi:hypothetical protein ACIP2X_15645 [Streptomyces sp. NPDC089424]|uniref:hypothetical protein n=1 Tax=Streptomyces sp. NPDC089424 TaxID=3365917 RepID=UPI00380702B0
MTQQPPPPGFGPPPPGFGPPPPGFGPPPQYGTAPAPQYGATPPGPEFLAIDKQNSVVIDASGVALEMYGTSVEFDWPEIRGVHHKASPDGKALMVAVVHLDGRVYEAVVQARPKSRLHEWFAQLAWVLNHYRPAY